MLRIDPIFTGRMTPHDKSMKPSATRALQMACVRAIPINLNLSVWREKQVLRWGILRTCSTDRILMAQYREEGARSRCSSFIGFALWALSERVAVLIVSNLRIGLSELRLSCSLLK